MWQHRPIKATEGERERAHWKAGLHNYVIRYMLEE